MSDSEPATLDNRVTVTDETTLSVSTETDIAEQDLENLEKMDALEYKTEEIDGRTVATSIVFDLESLAMLTGELDTVERRLGDDWRETSWNPHAKLYPLRR